MKPKRLNTKILKLFHNITILLLLVSNYTSLIVPDNTNPLLLNKPSPNNTGYTLSISFSLSGNSGIIYNQFIGVVFPKSIANKDLYLSKYSSEKLPEYTFHIPRYSCELSDLNNSRSLSITAYPPLSQNENNIAYCLLQDKQYSVTTDINYRLIIKLDYIKLSTLNYVPSIGLILTTSNDENKIIIDYLPVLGSIGQYKDWESNTSSALAITDVEVSILSGSGSTTGSTTLYPYNYFDLKMNFSVKSFIAIDEVYIILKFPENAVSLPTDVTSTTIDANDSKSVALSGTLVLSQFEECTMRLEGITEDLYSGRLFQLNLKDLQALDNVIGESQSIEVFVYYKNTYSVLSYSTTASFYITQSTINISSINHAESENIYQNSLWPMRFVFSANTELENGGYVLLQNINAQDKYINMNFVASSCDFSENLDYSSSTSTSSSSANSVDFSTFGSRPVCHPLINDFNYTGASQSSPYNGSGVFFKFPYIVANKNYYLTVWIMAENCGSSNTLGADKNSVQFSFKLSVYKEFDSIQTAEKRLNFDANVVLATSIETSMMNKCFSSALFKGNDNYEKQLVQDGPLSYGLLFKEYTEIELVNSLKSCSSNCYLNDISNEYNKKVLYYNTDIVVSNDYIYPLLEVSFNVANGSSLSSGFPFPLHYLFDSSVSFTTGKINLLYSKPFFTNGNYKSEGKCYASWGFKLTDQTTTFINLSATDSTNTSLNYITSNDSTLDIGSSSLPSYGPKTMYTLKSKYLADQSSVNYLGTDYSVTCSNSSGCKGKFVLFTNCLSWKTKAYDTSTSTSSTNSGNVNTIKSIKSIFFYFEVMYQFMYLSEKSDTASPLRVVRLIKLYPEVGVFNDPDSTQYDYTNDNNSLASNLFTFHTSFGSEAKNNVVCVYQFKFNALNKFINYDTSMNLLTIFLFNTNLLNVDITDLSSVYPIINDNNEENILSYGYNSQYLISEDSSLNSYFYGSLDTRFGSEITHYFFYFSSILQFTDFSNFETSSSNENDLLIPVYCPREYNQNLNIPVVSMILNTITNTDSQGSNEIITSYDDSIENTSSQKIYSFNMKIFRVTPSSGSKTGIQFTPDNIIKYVDYKSIVIPATIRFNNYVSDSRNDQVNVFLGAVNKTNSNFLPSYSNYSLNLSCAIWFVHSSISIKTEDYNTEITNKTTSFTYLYQNKYNPSISSSNKGINIHGKFFTRIFVSIYKPELSLTTDSDIKSIESYSSYNSKNEEVQIYKGSETSNFSLINGAIRPEINFFLNKKTDDSIQSLVDKSSSVLNQSKSVNKNNSPGYIPVYSQDLIGFYSCYSSTISSTETNYSYTNFITDTRNLNTVYSFLLDFNPVLASSGQFSQSYFDIDDTNEVFYANDIGAGIRFEYELPIYYTSGGYLRFSSYNSSDSSVSMFNPNTVCGLSDDEENYVDDCFNQTNGVFKTFICPLKKTKNTVSVCCYNIKLNYEDTDESLNLKLNQLELIYKPDSSSLINISNYFSNVIVGAASSDIKGVTIPDIQSLTTLSSLGAGLISNIEYDHVNQESGIGRGIFYISLPRKLMRNASIIISGDFTNILIENVTPKCIVTTSSNYIFGESNKVLDSGDAILKSCDISNIKKTKNSIIIRTKKTIYKCSISFSYKLYMLLSPIQQFNWNNSPYKDYLYTLNIFTEESGEDLIYNNTAFKMPTTYFDNIIVNSATSTSSVSYTPNKTELWGSLCNVINVFPRFPDESAFYDFEFDLVNTSGALYNQSPNELSIFFPYIYYSQDVSELKCGFTNNKLNYLNLNCVSTIEGILNIKFESVIPYGKGERMTIRVHGIKNPYLNGTIYFPCSINKIDYLGQRVNLVTGSGSLIGGISFPTSSSSSIIIGNLKVINKSAISDSNTIDLKSSNTLNSLIPRQNGNLNLRVSFDRASNSSIPSSLSNYPIIIINLPDEYRLYDYDRFSISSSIEIWLTVDGSVNQTKSSNLKASSIKVFYNNIVIYLNSSTITIDSKFAYFDITLKNVPSPSDTIESTSVFKVLITNENREYIFKVFTNLNTMSTKALSNKIDNYIAYYRGLAYTFDYSKHITDITESNLINIEPAKYRLSLTKNNYLTFSPGKYYEYSFYISKNALLMQLSTLKIYLVNDIFKTKDEMYYITPGYQSTNFMIGTSCFTAAGMYVLFFSQNNKTNFSTLPQIIITLKNIEVDYIKISYSSSLPTNSSTFLYYDFEILSVDSLFISWSESYSTNDATAAITSASIDSSSVKPYSIFSIFSNTTNTQYFKALNPNYCFHLKNTELSFSFGKNYANLSDYISSPSKLKSLFQYSTSDDNDNLNENSIRVSFTPTESLVPVFISCIIVCYNDSFPSSLDNYASSDYFHKGIVSDYNSTYEFDFNGLMRSFRYKIQCILSSTHSTSSLRSSVTISFTDMKNSSSKINTNITVPDLPYTQCISYTFASDPGYLLKINLLNNCQLLFSNISNTYGCITCVDAYGNTMNGSSFTNVNKCSNSINNLQTDSYTMNSNNEAANGEDIYRICIVADYFCKYEIEDSFVVSLNEFSYKTSTSILLSDYLGFPLTNVDKVTRYSDITTPIISNFVILESYYKTSGEYYWSVKSESSLYCYWRIYEVSSNINVSTLDVTFNDIFTCDSSTNGWCGKTQINSNGGSIKSQSSNLTKMTPSEYTIWLACFNDLPYFRTQSDVYVLQSFEVIKDNIKVSIIDKNNSNYYKISTIILFIVSFILY